MVNIPTSGHGEGGFFPFHPHGSRASQQSSLWYHYHSLECSPCTCPENWEPWGETAKGTPNTLCIVNLTSRDPGPLIKPFLLCCPLLCPLNHYFNHFPPAAPEQLRTPCFSSLEKPTYFHQKIQQMFKRTRKGMSNSPVGTQAKTTVWYFATLNMTRQKKDENGFWGPPEPEGSPRSPWKTREPRHCEQWADGTGILVALALRSPTLTCPHSQCPCCPLAGSAQGAVRSSKNPRGFFSFQTLPCALSSCHLPWDRKAAVPFLAKATALDALKEGNAFVAWGFLSQWQIFAPWVQQTSIPDTWLQPQGWEQPLQDVQGSASCRNVSQAAGNKWTFKPVCLDNRKSKNSAWQVIPLRAALRGWQVSKWHSSSGAVSTHTPLSCWCLQGTP